MALYGTSPLAIWLWDHSATEYVDLTHLGVRLGDSLPLVAEAEDFLYIGHDRRFDAAVFWLTHTGDYSGIQWECSVGDGLWKRCIPVQPRLWSFSLVHDYIQLDLDGSGLREWAPTSLTMAHGMTPPEADSWYWLRMKAGSNTIVARLQGLTIRPFASLATPGDVQNQLQSRQAFTATTVPSFGTIEEYLRGAEDALFRITGRYYRPDFVEDELRDFKPYGMTLRNRPVLDILNLSVWTGNDWEAKDIGRDEDWHYEPETGLIYIATIFLDVVPPILRRGYSSRREQGAFKRAVRLRYVHGIDARIDHFSNEVKRTVIKQASIDTLMNKDFQQLIPQNLDRVNVAEKIKEWRTDIENFTDRYAKLYMV